MRIESMNSVYIKLISSWYHPLKFRLRIAKVWILIRIFEFRSDCWLFRLSIVTVSAACKVYTANSFLLTEPFELQTISNGTRVLPGYCIKRVDGIIWLRKEDSPPRYTHHRMARLWPEYRSPSATHTKFVQPIKLPPTKTEPRLKLNQPPKCRSSFFSGDERESGRALFRKCGG